jgi:hypothetical protein
MQHLQTNTQARSVLMFADQCHGSHVSSGKHGKGNRIVPDTIDVRFCRIFEIRAGARVFCNEANADGSKDNFVDHNNRNGQQPVGIIAADFHVRPVCF